MFYSIPRNSISKTYQKVPGNIDLNKFWREMADLYNVPYFYQTDDRLLHSKTIAPVRYDTIGLDLEYYDKVTDTWVTMTVLGGLVPNLQQVTDVGNHTTNSIVIDNNKLVLTPTSAQELFRINRPIPYVGGMPATMYMENDANAGAVGTYNSAWHIGFNVGGITDPAYGGIGFSIEPDYRPTATPMRELHLPVYHPGDGASTRLFSTTYSQGSTRANSSNLWYFRGTSFEIRPLNVDLAYFVAYEDGIKLFNPSQSVTNQMDLYFHGSSSTDYYGYLGLLGSPGDQNSQILFDARPGSAPIRLVAGTQASPVYAADLFQDGSFQIGSVGTQIADTRFFVKGLGATSATYAVKVRNSANTDLFKVRNDGIINLGAAPSYADNAAAITGGLAVGDVYRTGDLLKIVH